MGCPMGRPMRYTPHLAPPMGHTSQWLMGDTPQWLLPWVDHWYVPWELKTRGTSRGMSNLMGCPMR